ncbi:MAG: TIGR02646 family protein [Bacteroidia bacterium]|nr:TIGR02646 family protein [Bacteroidia bacterium]
MKHIQKDIANEPQSLRDYRNNTPNAVYDGGNFDTQALKTALLKEQGYLCAYCLGKIGLELGANNKPKVEVEHVKPRKKYPKDELDYNNMVAVCNGLSEIYPDKVKVHHCDKTQGSEGKMNGMVELKKLNPLHKASSEDLIGYNLNGKIKSFKLDPDVEHDLNTALNLNNDSLMKNRRVIIDPGKGRPGKRQT